MSNGMNEFGVLNHIHAKVAEIVFSGGVFFLVNMKKKANFKIFY